MSVQMQVEAHELARGALGGLAAQGGLAHVGRLVEVHEAAHADLVGRVLLRRR